MVNILQRLGEFFAIPKDATLWGAINAPIAVAIAAALFAWLLKDRVQEFVKDTNQFRALEGEEPPLSRQPTRNVSELEESGQSVSFSEASDILVKLKKFIDEKAARAPDGRNRRKYSNYPRYDYIPLVRSLQDDGNMDSDLASALIEVLERWRPYRNGRRSIPKNLFDAMCAVLNRSEKA